MPRRFVLCTRRIRVEKPLRGPIPLGPVRFGFAQSEKAKLQTGVSWRFMVFSTRRMTAEVKLPKAQRVLVSRPAHLGKRGKNSHAPTSHAFSAHPHVTPARQGSRRRKNSETHVAQQQLRPIDTPSNSCLQGPYLPCIIMYFSVLNPFATQHLHHRDDMTLLARIKHNNVKVLTRSKSSRHWSEINVLKALASTRNVSIHWKPNF